ncbi:hypothetical protein KQI76_07630 [Amphibacillus sp. MSJ-3]|uniref:hypothetical protein n=1 Tax=Amphibacillus sp. MSJ-3 TaxID=2841505 RepID=UPI001C0E9E8C|nr:hypothetical protein [Amphibacillus sp. MSJ-3]MBU5595034.1 hypothetical protein [Amphibacillus sp. MSJ-3]
MKCTIQSQGKQATLVVKQLILFQNCKIIHAQGRSSQDYYLFFHKNRYVNTLKATKIKADSFLNKAIEHGLIVLAPHHAIYSLVHQQTFPCIPLNKMINQIENQHMSLEQIIILSYFDQSIEKDKVIKLFVESFRNYRRNGKMQKAYQVLIKLKDYAPENQLVNDILNTLTFQNYQPENQEDLAFNPLQIDKLEKIYLKANRHLDISILSTVKLLNGFTDKQWQLLLQTLSDYPLDIQTKTLFNILKQKPDLIDQKEFAESLLKLANANKYFNIVMKPEYSHPIDTTHFIKQLEHASQDLQMILFNQKQQILIDRIASFSKSDKEKTIRLIIETAIKVVSIDRIIDWLESWEEPFSFHKQLLTIKELMENPDEQEELADFYQYFNHKYGAIECLKWEIELHPTKESAHKKLVKLLKETNQNDEASAYQEQWIQQTKYSS